MTSGSSSDSNFVMRYPPSYIRWAPSGIDWRRGRRYGNLSPIGRYRSPASTASLGQTELGADPGPPAAHPRCRPDLRRDGKRRPPNGHGGRTSRAAEQSRRASRRCHCPDICPGIAHQEAGAQTRGNQIVQMAVPLPIGIVDPVARLRAITGRRRSEDEGPAVLCSCPHRSAGRALLLLVKRQRVNVATTDIVGPEVPLYLAGARLLKCSRWSNCSEP